MPTIGFEIKRKCKLCGKVFVAKHLTVTIVPLNVVKWLGNAKGCKG